VEIYGRGRIRIVHHLAMVATFFKRVSQTSGSHRGHAVEFYGRGRIRIVHHLAMVATGIAVEIYG
jgi:hypothetical protein